MNKSCRLCWSITILLLVAIGAMAYLFVIKGSTLEASDGRTAIILSAGERDLVLGEMREFLETVQIITESLAEKDMKAVSTAALKVGSASVGGVPLTLMAKLPIEFKTLGLETHGAFDELAESSKGGSTEDVLAKLGVLMNNCTTCHSGYRIDAEVQN